MPSLDEIPNHSAPRLRRRVDCAADLIAAFALPEARSAATAKRLSLSRVRRFRLS